MSFNGFTYEDLKPIALDNKCILGEQIVAHTSKKIEYVARYVDEWLYVIENISGHIFFIDAMSNAGLYENNFLSTALEVLNVFIRHAQRHQDRNYYLFCNDYDKKKIKTLTALKKSAGFIRSELARRVNLRNTPEIIFELDDSMEYGARIDSILKEIMPKKEEEK